MNHETPAPFTADRVVAINVDVQNDFCPGGALAVNEGTDVIPPLNELNRKTRELGGIVAFTRDQHPAITRHFIEWPVHCVAGTEGGELHEGLVVEDDDVIIDKGTGQEDGYSGFEGASADGQTLERIVTPTGRERVAVLIGGLATDFCVLHTVNDALAVDPGEGEVEVYVARDAIRGVNLQPEDSKLAIREMEVRGAHVVPTVDILTGRAFALATEGARRA